MVKLLKLKMKKVSVNLKSLKIERWQIEALSDQKKTLRDCLIVVKVVDDNLTEADVRTNQYKAKDYKVNKCGVVANMLDCLVEGKVTRLKQLKGKGMKWAKSVPTSSPAVYASYVLGSQRSIQEDSEDNPKKRVPSWAEEKSVMKAVLVEVDPDLIFAPCDTPDLEDMFPRRHSSPRGRDIWNSPGKSDAICDITYTKISTPICDDEDIIFDFAVRQSQVCKTVSDEIHSTSFVRN